MSISAKIIADSISPSGVRITTMQLSYPRFIHSETLTHRMFSRNAASSRAIPIQKMIDQVLLDPAMPVFWGKNEPGMQAQEELEPAKRGDALVEWLNARRSAVAHAERMIELGVHKQIANRLLEPFQEMQTIVTATEWSNFYNLRRHADAQPEMKVLADAMWEAKEASTPILLNAGEWHLPYILKGEVGTLDEKKKWSVARCARVSFLNHDNQSPDGWKDVKLHDRLLKSGHFSPFEHIATPVCSGYPAIDQSMNANLRGWQSYRLKLAC